MDIEVDIAFKDSVVAVEVDGSHIYVLVIRDNLGDLAYYTDLVNARDIDLSQEGKNLVAFPAGRRNAVALA